MCSIVRCLGISIIDPTSLEQPGLIKARILAKALGARLHLLACETRFTRESRAVLAMRSGGDAPEALEPEELLEELAAPARAEGIDVYVHGISGEPLQSELLLWIERQRPDLVVKDTHHHSLIRRTLLTNTDWQLIRGCPAPLLLTKQAPWPSAPSFIAAIDPGHPKDRGGILDLEILGMASYLSKCLGSQMQIAHAYFPPTMPLCATSGLPTVALSGPGQVPSLTRFAVPHGYLTAASVRGERVSLEEHWTGLIWVPTTGP